MEVKGALSKLYTNSCAEIISQAGYVLIQFSTAMFDTTD